jgi:hypothetical protein
VQLISLFQLKPQSAEVALSHSQHQSGSELDSDGPRPNNGKEIAEYEGGQQEESNKLVQESEIQSEEEQIDFGEQEVESEEEIESEEEEIESEEEEIVCENEQIVQHEMDLFGDEAEEHDTDNEEGAEIEEDLNLQFGELAVESVPRDAILQIQMDEQASMPHDCDSPSLNSRRDIIIPKTDQGISFVLALITNSDQRAAFVVWKLKANLSYPVFLEGVSLAKMNNNNKDLPTSQSAWQAIEEKTFASIVKPFEVLVLHYKDKQGTRKHDCHSS